MSEIEGFCDRCGLMLPDWKGNQRPLCACEKKVYNDYSMAFLETEGEMVRRELAASQRFIRVLGLLVLCAVLVVMGLTAFWFGLWIAGGCFLGAAVLGLGVGFAVMVSGEQNNQTPSRRSEIPGDGHE